MKVGTSQVDITPKPGLDLTGFAVRPQPSTDVLDPLWIRALYLEDGAERCLWLHADLLALDQPLAERLRRRIAADCGIAFSRIILVTTHTHSGPAAIQLTDCGAVDPAYVAWLEERFHQAARLALDHPEPGRFLAVRGRCEMARERRQTAFPHTDPRVGALGWRRGDGSFQAVLVCYSMHPVCLVSSQISADWPGETARILSDALPGRPVVLVSSGACGNINPPRVGLTPQGMREVGRQVAQSVVDALRTQALKAPREPELVLKFASANIALPWEDATVEQVQKVAADGLANPAMGGRFPYAVKTWRDALCEKLRCGEPPGIPVELGMWSFGPAAILTINAEIFSQFNALTNASRRFPVYTVGCANGMIGYVAPAHVYGEGGYEIAHSMFFYNVPRPRKGGFELLAQQACRLLDVDATNARA